MVHRLRRAGSIRPSSSRSSVFRRDGDRLSLRPCVPAEWSRFEITYRFRSATYAITVEMTTAVGDDAKAVASGCDDSSSPGTVLPWPTTARSMKFALSSGILDRMQSGAFEAERKKEGRSSVSSAVLSSGGGSPGNDAS